ANALTRERIEQAVLHREQGGAGARGDAELRVDVLHVRVGRLRRDHELRGDLPLRAAAREQAEHLPLAWRQSARQLAPAASGAGCGERALGRIAVEPPRAHT